MIQSSRSIPLRLPKALAIATALCLAPACAEIGGAPPPAGKAQENARPAPAGKKPVAVVKDFYAKLGKGDLPGLLENFAKDAKWVLHGPSGIPFAGLHEGVEGVRGFYEVLDTAPVLAAFTP